MLMGTWYIATLLKQQATGDADTFDWGMAPGAAVRREHHRHVGDAGHLRRPDRPRHQPGDRQDEGRRGQGVPRVRRRRAGRQGARRHRHHPGRHRRGGRGPSSRSRACRPTTCRSSPSPPTTPSRRTRCRSTPPRCRTSSTTCTRRSCPAARPSTRAITEAQSPGQERGPQQVSPGVRGPCARPADRSPHPQESPMATMPPAPPQARPAACGATRLVGWSFILPNFVGFALLTLVRWCCCSTSRSPTGTSSAAREWTGLANFRRLMHDAQLLDRAAQHRSTTRCCTSR